MIARMGATRIARSLRLLAKRLAYGGGVSQQQRERVVSWLALEPGMKVADIGSGFGAYAFAFARVVGHAGVVYAVDTDADLRWQVAQDASGHDLHQVHPIEGQPDDPSIPEPVDLVFLSASFHHLSDRSRYFRQLRDCLRPGARVVIIESRPGSCLRVPGHATPPAEVRATLEAAGYLPAGHADIVAGASLQAFRTADQEAG